MQRLRLRLGRLLGFVCEHNETQRHPVDWTVDAVYEWCPGGRK